MRKHVQDVLRARRNTKKRGIPDLRGVQIIGKWKTINETQPLVRYSIIAATREETPHVVNHIHPFLNKNDDNIHDH